jgi:hypothetical protein
LMSSGMSYLDTNRLANQMGERGKSYTGEALQCNRSQVSRREDYRVYSEIHCDRAGFLLCIGGAPLQRCSLGFENEPALATEGTETLPQAPKRDPGTDGRYARLKGVLHSSPIHQM